MLLAPAVVEPTLSTPTLVQTEPTSVTMTLLPKLPMVALVVRTAPELPMNTWWEEPKMVIAPPMNICPPLVTMTWWPLLTKDRSKTLENVEPGSVTISLLSPGLTPLLKPKVA
ncbi:MAG: hypothetical protein PCFJNLEI_03944 [Verrucomicrobiae bacterium]|nr:hypothetical protein [Verrucomicrobiae bacterium]